MKMPTKKHLGVKPPKQGHTVEDERASHFRLSLLEAADELSEWVRTSHDADCPCGCHELAKLFRKLRISAGEMK